MIRALILVYLLIATSLPVSAEPEKEPVQKVGRWRVEALGMAPVPPIVKIDTATGESYILDSCKEGGAGKCWVLLPKK